MKKILLIDADSTIPNLALMKLSTFHKSKKDIVEFKKLDIPYYPNKKHINHFLLNKYDKIYCSIIFDGSINWIKSYKFNNIIFGGTGYSLSVKLPDYIENLQPDYNLYPNNDISYGFISRGCIRKCSFCKVPQKEGYIHQVNTVENIVKHKKVKFLDNNFLALPNHKEILRKLIKMNIKCQFKAGLDIRLVDKENSFLLSKLNYLGDYFFSFDNWSYLEQIEEGLLLLLWKKDWQLKFLVYCNSKMKLDNIVKRIKYLRKNKYLPYIMRDINCWGSEYELFYTDIAAWCNQVNLFKKMSFIEFLNKRHLSKNAKKRIEFSKSLYYNS